MVIPVTMSCLVIFLIYQETIQVCVTIPGTFPTLLLSNKHNLRTHTNTHSHPD